MATIEDFKRWIETELTRFSFGADHIEVVNPGQAPAQDTHGECFTIRIYTNTNIYQITAREVPDDTGYLGCGSTCRKPRADEDWHRGNDLADGPLSRETWERIKGDIISYEMVNLHVREPVGLGVADESGAIGTGGLAEADESAPAAI